MPHETHIRAKETAEKLNIIVTIVFIRSRMAHGALLDQHRTSPSAGKENNGPRRRKHRSMREASLPADFAAQEAMRRQMSITHVLLRVKGRAQ